MIGVYVFTTLEEVLYIGGSNDIQRRYKEHEGCYRKKVDFYFYKYLYDNNIIFSNLNFVVLEECKIDDLRITERNYVDIFNPICNMILPYTSKDEKKEYDRKKCRKNKYKEQAQKYYQKHKEKKCKNRKKYYQEHKEEINTMRKNNRSICNLCFLEMRTDSLKDHQLYSNNCNLFLEKSFI